VKYNLYDDAMGPLITGALKSLLCEKHLYQYVEVDLKPLLKVSKELNLRRSEPTFSPDYSPIAPTTVRAFVEDQNSVANIVWIISSIDLHGEMEDVVSFELPSINTHCATCDGRPPFNPIGKMSCCLLDPKLKNAQWYHLAYECQQCKGPPVVFLVRREGLKLRLSGRDPLEVVPPPKVLPKAQREFFSNAQIAHHAGQTLAAIFLLRTFIEQFWRSIPEVQRVIKDKQGRATGDEQGSAYQTTLPTEFSNRFPSLLEIYGKLSASMHEAIPDATLFEDSCVKIEEHFDARKVFKLFAPVVQAEGEKENTQ
jgi:hypothetical protein